MGSVLPSGGNNYRQKWAPFFWHFPIDIVIEVAKVLFLKVQNIIWHIKIVIVSFKKSIVEEGVERCVQPRKSSLMIVADVRIPMNLLHKWRWVFSLFIKMAANDFQAWLDTMQQRHFAPVCNRRRHNSEAPSSGQYQWNS